MVHQTLHYTFSHPIKQVDLLLQRNHAMLRVTEYFAKSLKVTETGTI